MRSGSETSSYRHVGAISPPSGEMTVACQDPPVRTSSTALPALAGSQPSKLAGSVRTCQTLSRGAFRVRVTVNSLIGDPSFFGGRAFFGGPGRAQDEAYAPCQQVLADRVTGTASRCGGAGGIARVAMPGTVEG